jgi:hypothetical protein
MATFRCVFDSRVDQSRLIVVIAPRYKVRTALSDRRVLEVIPMVITWRIGAISSSVLSEAGFMSWMLSDSDGPVEVRYYVMHQEIQPDERRRYG